MTDTDLNSLGQPIGRQIPDWSPPPRPARRVLEGRFCRLEPLDPIRHGEALYQANGMDREGKNWTYLPYGPFGTRDAFDEWLQDVSECDDPLFFAIVDSESGRAHGVASYLRIKPENGSIEVGHINYSPLLQRTPAATEAMYLMMAYAFELGYRRYEWKCHSLNAPSRSAAQRLGFSFEGIFRQATVVKGRNRDTAWFAVIDQDWPAIKAAHLAWLSPSNFTEEGKQRTRLSELTAAIAGG